MNGCLKCQAIAQAAYDVEDFMVKMQSTAEMILESTFSGSLIK
ncbi:hypothetical protein [Calothrix sp. NIES-2100]